MFIARAGQFWLALMPIPANFDRLNLALCVMSDTRRHSRSDRTFAAAIYAVLFRNVNIRHADDSDDDAEVFEGLAEERMDGRKGRTVEIGSIITCYCTPRTKTKAC